jgi:hypothetical protein
MYQHVDTWGGKIPLQGEFVPYTGPKEVLMTDFNAPAVPPTKRPKGRSPGYPSIDLGKAVQRVGLVYAKERQYPVSTSVIPSLWSYASLNGPASQQLSALLKFGLMAGEGAGGNREVKVTDLAVQILNHPSSDARQDAIKTAALLPAIHREMWDQYGTELPSDSNLLWRLTRERGFTDTGAREFIREWRDTLAFAKLDSDDATAPRVSAEHELEFEEGPELDQPQRSGLMERALESQALHHAQDRIGTVQRDRETPLVSTPGLTAVPIPLPGGGSITVQAAFPITEANWNYWQAVLAAMKPGLVSVEPPDPSAEQEEG